MRTLLVALLLGCSANDSIPAPIVAAVQPDHAPVGAVVTVTGQYFCQTPPMEDPNCSVAGSVHFGTTPGIPTTWMDTEIMVEVPNGITGTVDIQVTAMGKQSNTVSFTVQ